ncbi:MAG: sugar nucleotide-binding protein, partial [Clostridia bacterium]
MKVFVLGSKGMLGRYIASYLKREYKIIEINRLELDADIASERSISMILDVHDIRKGDVVINCMGTIKPRVDELGKYIAIKVNSVFPHQLETVALNKDIHLIHPTTDCVFSGNQGRYIETDLHDVSDIYGRTKSLGEPEKSTVIRTSIIGEEISNKRSLVEWIKSQKDKEVNGFTNHFWNGITCLQFAKICEKIINEDLYWEGVRHIFSPSAVTKAELVKLVSDEYDLNLKIKKVEAEIKCDRTLRSIFPTCNNFNIPELHRQIHEMKEWN